MIFSIFGNALRKQCAEALPGLARRRIITRERISEGILATVLVADEDLLARADVREGLRGAGFRVSEASGAAEAVSKIKRRHYDCVIAGASSAEIVLAALPSLPGRTGTPVIVVADRYDAERAMRDASSGAIDRLTRPVSPAGLIAAVERALDASADELHARRIMLARSAEFHRSLARLVATARVPSS